MHDSPASFDADSTRHFLVKPFQRHAIRTAMVMALVVYAAYLVYRGLYTINVDALGFSLAVYAAEIHGFVSLFLYFHRSGRCAAGEWSIRRRR
jgi:hypothetical protein